MSFTTTYPFNTPANYIYDTYKIEVTGGKAQLKLIDNPGQDFVEEFLNDTGFTYNSLFAEFVGGEVRQKDTRDGALFGANFSVNQNASWSTGSDVGTLYGGATITSEQLDLSGGVTAYEKFTSTDNLGIIQGTIKFKITPQYSGSPPEYYWFLCDVNTVGIANEFSLFQTTAGNLCLTARDSTGSIVINTVSFGNWGQTASQEYEFALCFDISPGGSEIRLFIDGQQKGSTITTGYTRNDHGRLFFGCEWSESTNADFLIDDILLFDTVQHTTNYTPGYTVNDTIYVETSVILPEMEWTGAGTLVSFDSFSTTENGSPRYTLQIGRSGDYLYWNGSAWVVSDGTYNQANSSTVFNANVASLAILGEIYGQFEIIFPNSNTQSDVSELTASLTAQIYPTDNPTIEPTTSLTMEELIGFDATTNVAGSDLVKYTLKKGDDFYYYTGLAWTVSDETYAQTNTLAEILANKSTFTTTGIVFKWKSYLHSDDGTTTPDIDIITVEYDFFAEPEDVNVCIVWGYNINNGGAADDSAFTVQLSKDAVKYKDETILRDDIISVSPDASTGYWDVELIETANMENGVFYNFTFGDRLYHKLVPNEATKNFWELEGA